MKSRVNKGDCLCLILIGSFSTSDDGYWPEDIVKAALSLGGNGY